MDENFDKLVNRLNRTYGCFLMWKYIRKSISIPESGQIEADRKSGIMNRYNGIFSGVLYATENAFITDLYKFFDKPKGSLKLETLIKNLPSEDQKEARSLIKSVEEEVKRIETLRHNFSAHEPVAPQREKIFTEEIEKIFSVVQKVMNLISKSIRREFMVWDLWENNTNQSFSFLLDDLELGYEARIARMTNMNKNLK
ncbi:MAG: hypothetical protein M1153_00870 [Patescibacteria group bacterium]|nr:hypothetical protein [Patescibacteria group bacterium]